MEENTATVHNLVACTLCSRYPRPVLGLPPDRYKLKPYRARAVAAPRALLAEFGTVVPDDVEIRVADSTSALRIDLPLKALVWQDAGGTTWLGYNDPDWLASRHETAADRASALHVMGEALAAIAREATGNVEEGSGWATP